jgi:hypothetical protein
MPGPIWIMILAIPNCFFSPPVKMDLGNLTFLVGSRFNVMEDHIDPVGNLEFSLSWLFNGLGSDAEKKLRELLDTWEVDMEKTMITIPWGYYEPATRDKVDWTR